LKLCILIFINCVFVKTFSYPRLISLR